MSLENQKKILRTKRLALNIQVSELGNFYAKFESGESNFATANLSIAYPIIKALSLSNEDLELIFK